MRNLPLFCISLPFSPAKLLFLLIFVDALKKEAGVDSLIFVNRHHFPLTYSILEFSSTSDE